MPLYEYRCDKCGRVSEFLEPVNAQREHVCEHCGSRKMHKELSACAVSPASSGGSGACGSSGPFR